MRKICLYAFICVSLIVFVNASVWEGAAAAASGGEVPENGLYIATNAFPVNSLVEVTNLDNGKTVRVVASSSLDSPGLLAVLSKEAANVIGLPVRSLGRVRMSQGEDPLAFPRFGNEFSSSGDPDYDPAVFVAINGYGVTAAADDEDKESARQGNERIEGGELIVDLPDLIERTAIGIVEEPVEEYIPPEYIIPAREEEIVQLEEVITQPEEEIALIEEIAEEEVKEEEIHVAVIPAKKSEPEIIKKPINPKIFPKIAEEPVEPETAVEIAMKPVEPEYDLTLIPAESRPPEEIFEIDESLIIAGIDVEVIPGRDEIEIIPEIAGIKEEEIEIIPKIAETAKEAEATFIIEPKPGLEPGSDPVLAEAHPEEPPEIPPELLFKEPIKVAVEIPVQPELPPEEPVKKTAEIPVKPELPPEEPVKITAEIPVKPELPPEEPIKIAVEIPREPELPPEEPVKTAVEIPREPELPPEEPVRIAAEIPVKPELPPEAPVRIAAEIPREPELPAYTPPSDEAFSVPLISSLEKGKYYLQIAAFSKAESVESELAKIDYRLPRAVMNAGTAEKPVYRILIGPVNLGESGALLQRFKRDFKDAFLRQGS